MSDANRARRCASFANLSIKARDYLTRNKEEDLFASQRGVQFAGRLYQNSQLSGRRGSYRVVKRRTRSSKNMEWRSFRESVGNRSSRCLNRRTFSGANKVLAGLERVLTEHSEGGKGVDALCALKRADGRLLPSTAISSWASSHDSIFLTRFLLLVSRTAIGAQVRKCFTASASDCYRLLPVASIRWIAKDAAEMYIAPGRHPLGAGPRGRGKCWARSLIGWPSGLLGCSSFREWS